MQIATHKRLTARQTNSINPQRRANANDTFNFFEGQQVFLRHKFDIVGRHAVETANVAAVCHTDSQIVVHSTERIDQPSL